VVFIAMNRFRIIKGEEAEFERIWAERDTHLNEGSRLRRISTPTRP